MGQFQQLCYRQKVQIYIDRYDVSALYALVYNISQGKKISTSDILGDHPSYDYEAQPKEEKLAGASILKTFKSILPLDKRARNQKKK